MPSDPHVTARIHSINVSGALRHIDFLGQTVTTGFFKSPIAGAAVAHTLGLEGDAQGDLSVHGGPEKAVYFYPREHYAAWEAMLGSGPLAPGSFGENITSEGWLESDLHIGDVLQIGTATLQVVQPRSPCYKLQIRFGRPDMTALFFRQGWPGWYASVLQGGSFSTADEIRIVQRAPEKVTVQDVWHSSAHLDSNPDTVARIMELPLLPSFWKNRVSRSASVTR